MAPTNTMAATSSCLQKRSEGVVSSAAAIRSPMTSQGKRRRRWGPRTSHLAMASYASLSSVASSLPEESSHGRDDSSLDPYKSKSHRRRDFRGNRGRPCLSVELRRPRWPTAGESSRMAPTSRSAWPPVFEDNGSAYVFDGRSGMFFEPESNFFYDPKTKLYYGNDAKKYFRFDFGHNRLPKFVPIPENNGLREELLPLRTADGAAKSGKTISSEQGKKTGKQPANNIHKRPADARISINIKTSILSERKDQATFVDRKRSENLDHIARWQGQKNQIKKVPEPEMESAAPTKDTTTKTSSPPPPLYMGDKVICVLCRRRFPSLAALERHEKLSQLHKVNLANQAEANNTMNALTSAKKNETERDEEQCYVDRAAKRRCLHNGTPDSASSYQHSASFVTDESTSSDTSLPALGEQNVGHQLFQKMMSKTDSSRVRDRDAMEIQNRLNSEWTRIEAISSQAAHAHRLNLLQKEKWGIGTL